MAFDQTGMLYSAGSISDPTTVVDKPRQPASSHRERHECRLLHDRDGQGWRGRAAAALQPPGGRRRRRRVDRGQRTPGRRAGRTENVTYVVAGTGGGLDDWRSATTRDLPGLVHTVVDDRSASCATHFHPSPFLDIKNRLWVSWVDNRDGVGNVYCAVSYNSGVSFSASRISSRASQFFFTTLIPLPTAVCWPGWGLPGAERLGQRAVLDVDRRGGRHDQQQSGARVLRPRLRCQREPTRARVLSVTLEAAQGNQEHGSLTPPATIASSMGHRHPVIHEARQTQALAVEGWKSESSDAGDALACAIPPSAILMYSAPRLFDGHLDRAVQASREGAPGSRWAKKALEAKPIAADPK